MAESVSGLEKLKQQPKKKSLRDNLQLERSPEVTPAEVPSFVPTTVQPVAGVPGPEEIKKRTQERTQVQQIAKAPTLKKPQDFDIVMKQIEGISSGMSPEQKKVFDDRRGKIQEAKEAAQKQFEETKNTNQWLEVAETLGQALVQLGAGAYGLKHNVDMSGLKFQKNDWSKNIDRAERELERKLGRAVAEEREVGKAESGIERKLSENANFRKRAILQNFMAEQQAYKQQTLQAQRLAAQIQKERENKSISPEDKSAKRAAEKELAQMIKKQEQKVKLLDKAYGEAQAVKEGEKGAGLEKVAKILGGEQGAQFREDIKTPVSIFGIELWKSSDEDEAPKVVKGYLDQAKAALEELKSSTKGLISGKVSKPSQPKQFTDQDRQALEWANANPEDPRAKEIKKRLGQ